MDNRIIEEISSKTGQKILFRQEKKDDLEAIGQLYSTLGEQSQESLPPFNRGLIERWSENLETFPILPILAIIEEDGGKRIIGRAVLTRNMTPRLKHRAEFGIVIYDAFQNLGIGTELIKFMLKIAEKHEVMKVTLEVFSENVKAIHVYKKCGFKKEGLLKKALLFP